MNDKLSNGHYFDAWLISDLCLAIDGGVSTTAQDIVEITSEDFSRRICVDLKDGTLAAYIDWDRNHQFTRLQYLALKGVSSKYKLEFIEIRED